MARNANAYIDLQAVVDNCRYARQLAGGAKVLAVVKADAYGHGAIEVADAIQASADALAVASIEEAIALRDAGISVPIILLEGFFSKEELPQIDAMMLSTVIHSDEQLEAFLAFKFTRKVDVWLKFNTGMNRLGFPLNRMHSVYEKVGSSPHVGEMVLMTHFACADDLQSSFTQQQIDAFFTAKQDLTALVSMASSPAILSCPNAHQNWVRPGIMLYGASPFNCSHDLADKLKPVMTLRSEIMAIHDLKAGDCIGYGSRFRCSQDTRIGVVAIGYGDGYPRSARDGTPVLVNGVRTSLIGRVSMDMITVDCTSVPNVCVGSPVELWGKNISVTEVARCSDTINYELLTRRPPRVKRIYSKN